MTYLRYCFSSKWV